MTRAKTRLVRTEYEPNHLVTHDKLDNLTTHPCHISLGQAESWTFSKPLEKLNSTVLNLCVKHSKIDSNISRRNLIEIPTSPTTLDLTPRIASKTSLSVTLEEEKSSSWPQLTGVTGVAIGHLPLTTSSNYSDFRTKRSDPPESLTPISSRLSHKPLDASLYEPDSWTFYSELLTLIYWQLFSSSAMHDVSLLHYQSHN
jgi:hypothetical protein